VYDPEEVASAFDKLYYSGKVNRDGDVLDYCRLNDIAYKHGLL